MGTAELYVQGTAGGHFCWKVTEDLTLEYDPSKEQIYQGRYTGGVSLLESPAHSSLNGHISTKSPGHLWTSANSSNFQISS